MRASLPLTLLLAPLCWAVACGGRYLETRDGEPEGGSGGTSQSAAGKSGAAGAATQPSAGRSGGPAVGGCGCDPLACGPGYVEVPNDKGCCTHCEVDANACTAEREKYYAFKMALLTKYATVSCLIDTDCTLYYGQNACESTCGIPTALSTLNDLILNLDSYATMACALDCPILPVPPCDPLGEARCLNGICAAADSSQP